MKSKKKIKICCTCHKTNEKIGHGRNCSFCQKYSTSLITLDGSYHIYKGLWGQWESDRPWL